MPNLHDIPKIELHRHLEGAVRPSTILEIARKQGFSIPAENLEQLKKAIYIAERAESIHQVFERFHYAQECFVGPEEIRRITSEVVEDAAADNIVLLELRFSPSFMTELHSVPWDEVLDAIDEGVHLAQADHQIEVGLLIICSRDLGLERCDETIEFCLEHIDRIAGIDLAGDETLWPARRFASPFQRASKAGLKITVHAGEVASPSEVEDALSLLYANRIGHGVKIAESPALLRDIVEQKIPLELCPTSNVVTGAVASMASHPLSAFLEAGAVTTISSDDPEIFGIDLTHEYDACIREMGLSLTEIERCNRNAIAATFLPQESQDRARQLL